MTPSEIADWHDKVDGVWHHEAAAKIRELEAKCSEGALRHAATIRLASDIEANLKIATEALEKITGDIYDEEEASEETIAAIALARIKEVG